MGDVWMRVGDAWAVTVLPDGSLVPGCPQGDEEQARTSRELGYGADVGRMVVEHEVGHSALAYWLGLPFSPVIGRVALDPAAPATELTNLEEAAVLAIQAFALAIGVRLSDLRYADRPSPATIRAWQPLIPDPPRP